MTQFSRNKAINTMANTLVAGGWDFRIGKRHYILRDPITNFSLPVPGSPSDGRSEMNWMSAVKKIKKGIRPH